MDAFVAYYNVSNALAGAMVLGEINPITGNTTYIGAFAGLSCFISSSSPLPVLNNLANTAYLLGYPLCGGTTGLIPPYLYSVNTVTGASHAIQIPGGTGASSAYLLGVKADGQVLVALYVYLSSSGTATTPPYI